MTRPSKFFRNAARVANHASDESIRASLNRERLDLIHAILRGKTPKEGAFVRFVRND